MLITLAPLSQGAEIELNLGKFVRKKNMLKSYLVLDLPLDATDQEIRKKYLQLVKVYSPEKKPEMFRKITTAYEAIKDERTRAATELFSALKNMEFRETLETLAASVKITRRTPGLQELLKAVGKGLEG